MAKDQAQLSKTDIFQRGSFDTCLICPTETRKTYCSPKCKKVARIVTRMYRWDNVREKVLDRDDWTCKQCGKSIDEKFRELLEDEEKEDVTPGDATRYFHVTHLKNPNNGGSPLGESNLITLCQSCNLSTEDPAVKEMRTLPITTYLNETVKSRSLRARMFEGEDNPGFRCPNCKKSHSFREVFRYGKQCECGYELEIRAVAHKDNEEVHDLAAEAELAEEKREMLNEEAEEVLNNISKEVEGE